MGLKIFDLFCGAGGAAMGIHQVFPDADICGFDIKRQKNYPFNFLQYDVTKLRPEDFSTVDFVWASPPCQAYSRATGQNRNKRGIVYPDLIGFARDLLQKTQKPYVIENVPRSPLVQPITLCGQMFGLQLLRHRLFECSFHCPVPDHPTHKGLVRGVDGDFISCVDGAGKSYSPGENKAAWQKAMKIDWMTKKEMSEAVPPAYSKYIMEQWRTTWDSVTRSLVSEN